MGERERREKEDSFHFFWQLIFKTLQTGSCRVISGKEQRRSGDDTVVIDISDISLVALKNQQ